MATVIAPRAAATVPRGPDGEPARLLVVDDERTLADLLSESLSRNGYQVRVARTGGEAVAALEHEPVDLIILDVNLPDIDGFTVAEQIRGTGDETPIVFLTARVTTEDMRDGYDSGGDDYLVKPFKLEELCMRVSAVLRRTLGRAEATPQVMRMADLSLDLDSREVFRDGTRVSLSPTEFRLLRQLMPGKVMPKQDLMRRVWGWEFATDTSLVETYVFYLRRKIDTLGPRLIHTVRGVGYVMRPPGN